MSKHHISLTVEEKRWVAMITFDVKNLHHAKRLEAWNANEAPILWLVESLSRRGAIPEPRRRYWADPEYKAGRGRRSHKGQFERNGCKGKDIYRNAAFLPYLRYFLFGADLDEKVIKEFEDQVEDLRPITSGDIQPICVCARRLAPMAGAWRRRRMAGLDATSASVRAACRARRRTLRGRLPRASRMPKVTNLVSVIMSVFPSLCVNRSTASRPSHVSFGAPGGFTDPARRSRARPRPTAMCTGGSGPRAASPRPGRGASLRATRPRRPARPAT